VLSAGLLGVCSRSASAPDSTCPTTIKRSTRSSGSTLRPRCWPWRNEPSQPPATRSRCLLARQTSCRWMTKASTPLSWPGRSAALLTWDGLLWKRAGSFGPAGRCDLSSTGYRRIATLRSGRIDWRRRLDSRLAYVEQHLLENAYLLGNEFSIA